MQVRARGLSRSSCAGRGTWPALEVPGLGRGGRVGRSPGVSQGARQERGFTGVALARSRPALLGAVPGSCAARTRQERSDRFPGV